MNILNLRDMALFNTSLVTVCPAFENSAACALELVRGSKCFSDKTPTVSIKGDCWPPYGEIVTRYPLYGATKLNVFVDCIEGQSELIFGLISPHKRYSSLFVYHFSILLPYYEALMTIDWNVSWSIT